MIGRGQSLLTLALVLAVPFSGLLVMEQFRQALVKMHPQAQSAATAHLAAQLKPMPLPTVPAPGTGLPVLTPPLNLIADGFADDWRDWHRAPEPSGGASTGAKPPVRLAHDALFLYGLLDLEQAVQRWELWPDASQVERSLVVHVSGTGALTRGSLTGWTQRITVGQAPGETGFHLEWRLPRQLLGQKMAWQVDAGPRQIAQPLMAPPDLTAALNELVGDDQRLWLTDPEGQVLAQAGATGTTASPWWLSALTQAWLLRGSITSWEGFPAPLPDASALPWVRVNGDLRLITRAPVAQRDGWQLVLEAPPRLEQALPPAALAAMAIMALAGFVFAPAGLILSAANTRRRIRTLRGASQQAQLTHNKRLPTSPRNDPLDQLARQFNRLLDRQAERRDYLEQLGARLAHEIRTPLTAARSSLQRIDQPAGENKALVERASNNLERLSRLLQAMSESRRLEDSLSLAEWCSVDLNRLADHLLAAIADTDSDRRYRATVGQSPVTAHCAPDLLVLALEKMLANAREFTPPGGRIHLRVQPLGEQVELRLSNTGSKLPDDDPSVLFENLVSLRATDDGQPHLGLGLYLVRLIAEHHGGNVTAANTEAGVCFVFRFPRQ